MRRLVLGKVHGDASWTVLLVLILASGLTVWGLVPSVSGSLQTGLLEYGNRVSTYLVIQSNNGQLLGSGSPLLENLIPQIESIHGVQAVYPVKYNYTYEPAFFNVCLPGGSGCRNASILEGFASAAIGGENGYPQSLVTLVKGHMPQGNESAFVVNNSELGTFHNGTYRFEIGSNDWNSRQGVKFNATIAGVSALNPLTGLIQILWNRTFLQNELGSRLYNSTFGGPPNFMIIKADNVGDVQSVATSVSKLLESGSNFNVIYDQATLLALQALESQSAPLYSLLTGASLVATIAVVLLVSYLGAARRAWEPGLLLTQGWTWSKYSKFVLLYLIAIGLIASALSIMAVVSIGHFLLYQYQVSGNILTIRTTINPFYLISSVPLSLAVSAVVSLVTTERMKHMGLDNILREY